MPPSAWSALADALEAIARALREAPAVTPQLPQANVEGDRWVSAKQFSLRHPGFPVGTLRTILAARVANGLLERGIVKEVLERKVVIHEARFLAWLLRENDPGTPQQVQAVLAREARKEKKRD